MAADAESKPSRGGGRMRQPLHSSARRVRGAVMSRRLPQDPTGQESSDLLSASALSAWVCMEFSSVCPGPVSRDGPVEGNSALVVCHHVEGVPELDRRGPRLELGEGGPCLTLTALASVRTKIVLQLGDDLLPRAVRACLISHGQQVSQPWRGHLCRVVHGNSVTRANLPTTSLTCAPGLPRRHR